MPFWAKQISTPTSVQHPKKSTARGQTGFLPVIKPLSHIIQVGPPYNPGPKCAPRKFAKELSLGHPSRVATDEPLTGLSSTREV